MRNRKPRHKKGKTNGHPPRGPVHQRGCTSPSSLRSSRLGRRRCEDGDRHDRSARCYRRRRSDPSSRSGKAGCTRRPRQGSKSLRKGGWRMILRIRYGKTGGRSRGMHSRGPRSRGSRSRGRPRRTGTSRRRTGARNKKRRGSGSRRRGGSRDRWGRVRWDRPHQSHTGREDPDLGQHIAQ